MHEITISSETLIWVAGIVAACVTICTAVSKSMKVYNRTYDMVKHQDEQDKKIDNLREENTVILSALDGIFYGLQELGCNGEVHKKHEELQEYLRKSRK